MFDFSLIESYLVMPACLARSRQASSPCDLLLLQLSNPELTVPDPHLSVCLRPSVFDRMQGAISSEDEAAAVVLRGLSKRSAKGSSRTGVNSIRRAKAEKWFHDINRNVASARNATFYDSSKV